MNKEISLLNFHLKFMEEIRAILLSLGLWPNPLFLRKQPKNTIQLGFHLYGRYNLLKFLRKIGFVDREKMRKLVSAIKSYKTYGKHEIERRIMDYLREKGPLSTRELCNLLRRNRDITWKNLNRLVKKGIVKKILLKKRGPIEIVLWELKNNLNLKNQVN